MIKTRLCFIIKIYTSIQNEFPVKTFLLILITVIRVPVAYKNNYSTALESISVSYEYIMVLQNVGKYISGNITFLLNVVKSIHTFTYMYKHKLGNAQCPSNNVR